MSQSSRRSGSFMTIWGVLDKRGCGREDEVGRGRYDSIYIQSEPQVAKVHIAHH